MPTVHKFRDYAAVPSLEPLSRSPFTFYLHLPLAHLRHLLAGLMRFLNLDTSLRINH